MAQMTTGYGNGQQMDNKLKTAPAVCASDLAEAQLLHGLLQSVGCVPTRDLNNDPAYDEYDVNIRIHYLPELMDQLDRNQLVTLYRVAQLLKLQL